MRNVRIMASFRCEERNYHSRLLVEEMQNKQVFISLFTTEKWISVAVNLDDGAEMDSEPVKVVSENSSSDAEP